MSILFITYLVGIQYCYGQYWLSSNQSTDMRHISLYNVTLIIVFIFTDNISYSRVQLLMYI